MKRVMCINNTFPNPLYQNKLKIGDIYHIKWFGVAWNPPWWDNGISELCYELEEVLPEYPEEIEICGQKISTYKFRALFNPRAFIEINDEDNIDEIKKKYVK